jgi:hypothetical protein
MNFGKRLLWCLKHLTIKRAEFEKRYAEMHNVKVESISRNITLWLTGQKPHERIKGQVYSTLEITEAQFYTFYEIDDEPSYLADRVDLIKGQRGKHVFLFQEQRYHAKGEYVDMGPLLETGLKTSFASLNAKHHYRLSQFSYFGVEPSQVMAMTDSVVMCSYLNVEPMLLPIPLSSRKLLSDQLKRIGWKPIGSSNYFSILKPIQDDVTVSCCIIRDGQVAKSGQHVSSMSFHARQKLCEKLREINAGLHEQCRFNRIDNAIEFHCRFHELLHPSRFEQLDVAVVNQIFTKVKRFMCASEYTLNLTISLHDEIINAVANDEFCRDSFQNVLQCDHELSRFIVNCNVADSAEVESA